MRLKSLIAMFATLLIASPSIGGAQFAPLAVWQQSAVGGGCAGTTYGAYCWYLSAAGDSCDTACAGHGGASTGTINYSGSNGSLLNCLNVLFVLGVSGVGLGDTGCSTGLGCHKFGTNVGRCTTPATTTAASFAGEIRVCACNN